MPEWGAKLASLIHKQTGREYFFQMPGEKFRRGTYAGPYPDGEMSGFDEMFPTITECFCDIEPCTAPFDRWDIARQWGKLPVIPAFGSQEWELRITVGLMENPRRVEADGTIR